MHGSPHTVADVMTRTVVGLVSDTVFKDIVKAMGRWRISALPVVDADHRVLGVVSEADLLAKEEFRSGDPDRYARLRRLCDLAKAGARTAGELMTAPAVTVRGDATLAQAARTMARAKVKRLPVVDADGVLKGIVSRSDLLAVFLRDDEDIAREVRHHVVAFLFPDSVESIGVAVRDGVVTLTGRVRDTSIVPVAARLVGAVEGVVDVECALVGAPRRPDLDPDLPEDTPTGGAGGDRRVPPDGHSS
ncbi:CBS domain-containing protein [Streptomyces canus]|uniref:CBS domain-containing protein n=1 Tax=Streptomyces canus TaxID=58343 RepID=UPI00386CA105|nr:CBS domain-containing protein [Streptomyces canus]